MTKDLLEGLNEHLKLEFRASHEYLAMSIWLSEHDLPGFSAWMRKQSSDELLHAQRIIDHLVERDQKVVLPAIAAPPMTWTSAEALCAHVLKNEQDVTASIRSWPADRFPACPRHRPTPGNPPSRFALRRTSRRGRLWMTPKRWNAADGPLTEAGLRAKLESLGYRVAKYVYEPGTIFPDHKHEVDKIDAVLSGRFRLVVRGHMKVLGPGEWIEIPRGTIHNAAVMGDEPVVSLDAVKL